MQTIRIGIKSGNRGDVSISNPKQIIVSADDGKHTIDIANDLQSLVIRADCDYFFAGANNTLIIKGAEIAYIEATK